MGSDKDNSNSNGNEQAQQNEYYHLPDFPFTPSAPQRIVQPAPAPVSQLRSRNQPRVPMWNEMNQPIPVLPSYPVWGSFGFTCSLGCACGRTHYQPVYPYAPPYSGMKPIQAPVSDATEQQQQQQQQRQWFPAQGAVNRQNSLLPSYPIGGSFGFACSMGCMCGHLHGRPVYHPAPLGPMPIPMPIPMHMPMPMPMPLAMPPLHAPMNINAADSVQSPDDRQHKYKQGRRHRCKNKGAGGRRRYRRRDLAVCGKCYLVFRNRELLDQHGDACDNAQQQQQTQ